MDQLSFEDICRNRHRGNPQSHAAHQTRKDQRRNTCHRVLEAIRAAGPHGLTVDELSRQWDVPPNAISGRFTQLKAEQLIRKKGTRPTRLGNPAGVMIATT